MGDEAFLTAISGDDVAFPLLLLSDKHIAFCVMFSVFQAGSPFPGRADMKGAAWNAEINRYPYPWQAQDFRPAEGQTRALCFIKCFPF